MRLRLRHRRYGRAATTTHRKDTAASSPAKLRHCASSEMGRAGAGSMWPRRHNKQRGRHEGGGACTAAPRHEQQDGRGGRGVAAATPPRRKAEKTLRQRRLQSCVTAPAARWEGRARGRCGHAATTSSREYTAAAAPAHRRHGANSEMGKAGGADASPRAPPWHPSIQRAGS